MIRKIIVKVLVFVAVAGGTAFLVNNMSNSKLDNVSREMEEPKLPLVYCEYEGQTVNQMNGYTQVMSTGLMREGIVPVNDSYGVDLLVSDDAEYGVSYGYELRSIAGDSLVEEGTVECAGEYQGYEEYNVRFRMDMRENQEYVLVFIITNAEGEKARYYTRVVSLSEQYAKKIMDYAVRFHNTTFVKDVNEAEGNLVYNELHTTGDGNNGNLSHVNLSSSYDMVSWGNLKPIIVTGIIPSITEIDKEYAVVHLEYVVESLDGSTAHYYNVDEYYSARFDKYAEEVELLAFDRYIESIFDESSLSKDRNSICLGISDIKGAEYIASSDNKKVAFVKEGQLWYYDYASSGLISVFSFPQGNYTDSRSMNTKVDVNIADMDDDGNMYFVVYGYMNRGKHEGKNGISLYYFSSADSKIEERFFVECNEPFDVMQQETRRFTYYDREGFFYFLLAGTIYQVDLQSMSMNTMVYGLTSDKYMVSQNRKIVVYPNSDVEADVTGIIIHNFETGEEYTMSGGEADRFMALGFVGNDLIYGVARMQDIIISSDGETILPLYELFVVSPWGEVIKEYQKSNIYIMDARVQEDKIYLQRAVKQNNFFVDEEADFISYKSDDDGGSMMLQYSYDNRNMNQLDLVFPVNIYVNETVKPIMTKSRAAGNYTEMKINAEKRENSFYAFNNAGYLGEYKSAGRAILTVSEEDSGLVVDDNGNTIYRTLDATSYNTVAAAIDETPCANKNDSLLTCAYMCIEYVDNRVEYESVMACEGWEDAFERLTLGVGINISGIDLNTALYFLDRDVPFAACIEDGRYVLVISYNSTHIRYYDPMKGEEVKVTRKYFEELLSMQGNTMYTYTSQ